MKRSQTTKTTETASCSEFLLSLFPTEIGWMGFLGQDRTVKTVVIGHKTAGSASSAIKDFIRTVKSGDRKLKEEDWFPELRQKLQDYAIGKPVDFGKVNLQLPPQTQFRDLVLATTRSLGYGETTTYGNLARAVGHPGAARAVGTVMSTNRFPILIPCHRVLAAGGKLGGYTSPRGTALKQKLLDMERSCHNSCFD